jgi:hypothetical protein
LARNLEEDEVTNFDPLFPAFEEMDSRLRTAKHLRIEFFRGLVSRGRKQKRSTRVVEGSVALAVVAVAVFWAALLVPKTPEADEPAPQIDPTKLTLDAPRSLPSFDDTYRRHTGILDVLP